MSTARDRPSVKEAIEGLKVHQLRRENTVIFDEIKALRGDVAARQADIDAIRDAVSTLKSNHNSVLGHGTNTKSTSGASLQAVIDDLHSLRQD